MWQQRQRVGGMFKAVCSSCQGDSGHFIESFAALVRLADDVQEIAKQAEDAIRFLEFKGFGDPCPGMLVYRIARGKHGRQMLRIDGQEMLGLSELYPA